MPLSCQLRWSLAFKCVGEFMFAAKAFAPLVSASTSSKTFAHCKPYILEIPLLRLYDGSSTKHKCGTFLGFF
jgi:hypothetical protein